MILTSAGSKALADAISSSSTFTLATAEVGSGQYEPDGSETALDEPFDPKKEFSITGQVIDDNVLHIEFHDSTDNVYEVGEIGIFDSDGTLFAIESQTGSFLTEKPSGSSFLTYTVQITFTDSGATSVTFSGTPTFPDATTTVKGKVRLATPNEISGRLSAPVGDDAVVTADSLPVNDVRPIKAGSVQGTVNAIQLLPTPSIADYIEGQSYLFVAKGDSTGPVTVEVNGQGAKDLWIGGAAAGTGDILEGVLYLITYDKSDLNRFNVAGSAQSDGFNIADLTDALANNQIDSADRLPIGDVSDSTKAKYVTVGHLQTFLQIPDDFHLFNDVKRHNNPPNNNDRIVTSNVDVSGNPNEYVTLKELSNFLNKLLPDASSTSKGVLEIATNRDVTDGDLANVAVTPANLKHIGINEGGIPIASLTDAETSLQDTDRFVFGDVSDSTKTKYITRENLKTALDILDAFDLYEDVSTENSDPQNDDRILISNVGGSGEPNEYLTLSNLSDFINDELPKAATDTAGIIRAAKDSDVTQGTLDNVAVTPANLESLGLDRKIIVTDTVPTSNDTVGTLWFVY